jgi:hypothetical protein
MSLVTDSTWGVVVLGARPETDAIAVKANAGEPDRSHRPSLRLRFE